MKITYRTLLIQAALAMMAFPAAIYADTATFTYHDEVDKRMVREDYGQNTTPTFKITVIQGSGGSINPSNPNPITKGSSSPWFTISPSGGYHIRNVYLDGVEQGVITSYQFTNVITNHEITALFDAGITNNVKVLNDNSYWLTLESAYGHASTGNTIQCQHIDFYLSGGLLSVTKDIILEGGYDQGFDYKPGYTTLHGVLQIDGGSLAVNGIIVAD